MNLYALTSKLILECDKGAIWNDRMSQSTVSKGEGTWAATVTG